MKRPPKTIRLEGSVEEEVQKISEVTGLTESEILRQLITAGARALKAQGYKFRVPLHVIVAPEEGAGTRYPIRPDEAYLIEEGGAGNPSSSSEDIRRKARELLKKGLSKRQGGDASGDPPKPQQ